MANNYFESRFGQNYVDYQGKSILYLRNNIFNRYTDLFIKSDHKKADLLTTVNQIPRTYKLNPYVTLGSILKTQKNALLYEFISNKFDFILNMELRQCMPCVRCFHKRDKHSIIYSICMDNLLLDLAENSEPIVSDNIVKYIEYKYEELGRYYLMEKQGVIKIWMK